MTRLILRLASLPETEPLAAHDQPADPRSSAAPSSNGSAGSVTTVVSTLDTDNDTRDGGATGRGELVPPRVIELSRHERGHATAGSQPSPSGRTDERFPAEDLPSDQPDTDGLNGWMAATVGSTDSALVVDDRGRVAALSEPAARLLDCGPDVIGRLLTEAVNVVDLDSGAGVPVHSPGIPALDVLVTGGIRRSLMRIRRYDDALSSLDVCSVAVHGVDGAVVGSVTFLESVSG